MIHTIIAADLRGSNRTPTPGWDETVYTVNNDLLTPAGNYPNGMQKYTVTQRPAQLHTLGKSIDLDSNGVPTNPNIVAAMEIVEGRPWVKIIKGQLSDFRTVFVVGPIYTSEAEWKAHG